MAVETVLMMISIPVGFMLAGAVVFAWIAIKSLNAVTQQREQDALAELFTRETLEGELSAPKLRKIRARGLRRSTPARRRTGSHGQFQPVQEVTSFSNGTQRDQSIVLEATFHLANEGYGAEECPAVVVTEEDLEEIKLLPPPSTPQPA